jgi:23S rRNA pseudouridine955/2504/2580 synthase
MSAARKTGKRDKAPDSADPPRQRGAATVRHLRVAAGETGQRLDNFLLRLAKGVPKSHVYRIVRSGEVRVNRGRVGVDYRLQEGDDIRVPPLRVASAPAGRPPAPALTPPILYEDEDLIVVDKPAGIAAHGGSGVAHGIIERVRAARPQQPFLELAHRLDRETSGILLLAKSRRALLSLHEQLREGRMDKRYFVLVAGEWPNERQHVRLPLTKFINRHGERRVAVDPEGSTAHTLFTRQGRYPGFTLLEAQLKTGRTHQIRVHAAHLGFPIVGDDKYGDFELNRRMTHAEYGVRFDRMFLHAHATRLEHPVSGTRLALEAPLPADCTDLLAALETRSAATV